jgi:hypothetical protein
LIFVFGFGIAGNVFALTITPDNPVYNVDLVQSGNPACTGDENVDWICMFDNDNWLKIDCESCESDFVWICPLDEYEGDDCSSGWYEYAGINSLFFFEIDNYEPEIWRDYRGYCLEHNFEECIASTSGVVDYQIINILPEKTKLITIPDNFVADSLDFTSDMFNGVSGLIALLIGLPVGFWTIGKIISIIK